MGGLFRVERDGLGERHVPGDALYGIHTVRALENFRISGRFVHPELVKAYGAVKLACARVNRAIGEWEDDQAKAEAIESACAEMSSGGLREHVVVDALQGGAGTSLNMNVNEVLANRALELLGLEKGRYERVSPLGDINRHQSTNDTFPTALRVAAIRGLRRLEAEALALQEAFQAKEREFAGIVKVGRTEMQDAVLITLGREMGSYAEAFGRDRWRIYKCEERLRAVTLGGTAVGTGLGAPRAFIFRAAEALSEASGLPLSRADNLVEATANTDLFAEVSGLLRACAVNLLKACGDLRLLASGPDAGLGEIVLPALQAGSSIMPGKVNPVIPECVTQAAMKVLGDDAVVAHACASGTLELNPFLPLIADALLEELDLLAAACAILRERCIDGLAADRERCRRHVDNATASATALVPALGYAGAERVVAESRRTGATIKEAALSLGVLTSEQYEALTSPEAVMRLGSPKEEP